MSKTPATLTRPITIAKTTSTTAPGAARAATPTTPVAASITGPSVALAAAGALLVKTAVKNVASKLVNKTARAQQRAIPVEVLQHNSGLRRNQSNMMRAAVTIEAEFRLECCSRGLAGGQSELAEHELEFMASPAEGRIWLPPTRNAFGFMSRPVLNTRPNIGRAGGSAWRTGPSQSITNNFFNVGTPSGTSENNAACGGVIADVLIYLCMFAALLTFRVHRKDFADCLVIDSPPVLPPVNAPISGSRQAPQPGRKEFRQTKLVNSSGQRKLFEEPFPAPTGIPSTADVILSYFFKTLYTRKPLIEFTTSEKNRMRKWATAHY